MVGNHSQAGNVAVVSSLGKGVQLGQELAP